MTTSTNDERGLDYYDGRDDLIDVIRDTLRDAGRSPDHLELDDLALLDEFHALGRPATIALAELAGVRADARVLDVGAGIGGPARTVARLRGSPSRRSSDAARDPSRPGAGGTPRPLRGRERAGCRRAPPTVKAG